MSDKSAFDARLMALWNRRASLDKNELTELCVMVAGVLKKCSANRFEGLRDERDDYVHGFIINKVLQTARRDYEEREITSNYLLGFFYNYLKDQRDAENRRGAGLTDSLSDLGGHDAEGQDKEANIEDSREFNFSADEVEETLAHYPFSRNELVASAQTFYDHLQPWQQQALSRHLCADPDHALPLSQLQEQFPQTATYYKVKQLGVLHSVGHLPADYHKTEIGRWLTQQLNLKLTMEEYPMLKIALQLLCLVASQILEAD